MRQGLELRNASLWSVFDKARAAWARQGLESCGEGLGPGVGKARAAWARQD